MMEQRFVVKLLDLIKRMKYIKPYYDTIFWKTFKRKNINSSDSVRANGSFAFPSIKNGEKCFLIKGDIEMNSTIQSVLEYMTSEYND